MKFNLETRMFSEIGWSRNLPQFVKDLGWRDVVVFVDKAVYGTPYGQEIVPQFCTTVIEIDSRTEPTYERLQAYAEEVRQFKKWDGSVVIGGGSTIDMGKALAALRTNWLPAIEYRGFDKLTKPAIPTICVPTTAGTGSEVTFNASFIDTVEKKKLGINGRYMNATYAVLDAEWCRSGPMEAQISAGVDALVHCLESWMCKNHTQISRAFSREAFRLLYKNLPDMAAGRNTQARQNLLLGAFFAGAALYNSGSGIAGALSYPLGVHYGIPHGIAGGMWIADVISYNVACGWHDVLDLMNTLEPNIGWAPERATDFADMIHDLTYRLGVPRDLKRWGVTLENLPDLEPLQAAFDQNPVKFTAAQARKMIERRL